jgi:AraC-like DNA-binding protein
MKPSRVTSVLVLDGAAEFTRHDADARLSDRVDGYWTVTVAEPVVRLRMIPDGRIDAIVDLDTREAFVSGPSHRPFDVEHVRPTRLLGATMSPEAAATFLGAGIGPLGPGWRPLESLLGPLAIRIVEQIVAFESIQAKIAALETILLARIGVADRRVSRAIGEVRRSGGRIGVAALSRSSGASQRNLVRLFDQWVGLPPKTFARIARVQEVMRRMRESPQSSLKALAAELGFADQAHMSREVKRITGIQPGQMAETFKREAEIFKP